MGPTRSYKFDNFTLAFKRTALKDVAFKYRESSLIVQALKALGKARINDEVVGNIRAQLDEKARKRVLKETVTATGWAYDAIKRICAEGE